MRTTSLGLCALLVAATSSTAIAGKLHVPADFGTIQEAVDAARPGDKVIVAAGTYDGLVDIEGKKRLSLEGMDGAILDGGGGAGHLIGVYGSSGVTIRGLRLQHAQDAIVVLDSRGVSVRDCRIAEMQGAALFVDRATRVKISDCRVEDVRFGIDTEDTTNRVTIKSNTIRHCGQDGVRVQGDRSKVIRNEISECGNDGISIWGDRNKIASNAVSVCNDDGIEVWRAERNSFRKNVVTDIDEIGFQVEEGRRNSFVGNSVSDARDGAFWIDETADKLVKNVVRNCAPHGIKMTVGGNKLIKNDVSGSAQFDLFEDPDVAPANKYRRNTYTTTNMDPPP